jgi:hypothetical protein
VQSRFIKIRTDRFPKIESQPKMLAGFSMAKSHKQALMILYPLAWSKSILSRIQIIILKLRDKKLVGITQ